MNNYDMEAIGSFIAERRKRFKYTQNQLAEKLNVSYKAVSKWETGRSFPDLSCQAELCRILKIHLSELHTGKLNKTLRTRNKIVMATICILVFIMLLFLPASIYLYNYYKKSYNSFHVYLIEGKDDKNIVLRGSFIEYYKYNVFILNGIITNVDYDENDSITINIYCNDELIYSLNETSNINIQIDKKYSHDDNWTFKILTNNKETHTGSFFLYDNEQKVISLDGKKHHLSSDDIIELLVKDGFVWEEEHLTKIINKNERYIYLENEQQLIYNYDDLKVIKVLNYYYGLNEADGQIYYMDHNETTLVEKFIMFYNSNVFKCLTNECPGKEKLLNKISKYQSLLSVE